MAEEGGERRHQPLTVELDELIGLVEVAAIGREQRGDAAIAALGEVELAHDVEAADAGERQQEAIDELLAMIKLDRNWNEAAARQQLLKFFEALGFTDPLAVAGRKRLSTILFS